jgi:hypothetical protein
MGLTTADLPAQVAMAIDALRPELIEAYVKAVRDGKAQPPKVGELLVALAITIRRLEKADARDRELRHIADSATDLRRQADAHENKVRAFNSRGSCSRCGVELVFIDECLDKTCRECLEKSDD